MEKALRYELSKIPELSSNIFPTNAPEGQKVPYLVYMTKKNMIKDLNGITSDRKIYVMLNVFSNTYSGMKDLTQKVEKLIITFLKREIGQEGLYVQDITIDEISEVYENELKLQRGIIPFTIYYMEG